ncbi:MAG: PucR family transcriptional regulator [Kribbellaceae bacterium]|nr:helix-turn-helix domain-containing protein [Kribbellaceae bacterium]
MDSGTPIAAIVTALWDRAGELAEGAAKQIQAEIPFYAAGEMVGFEDLRASCLTNIEFMLGSMSGAVFDPEAARATGRMRAEQGAPLADVMAAYRVGTRYLWEAVLAGAAANGRVATEAVVGAASQLWVIQSVYTDAMSTAYRDAQTTLSIEREHRRSALVEAVLEGRVTDGGTLWEAADVLRLPHHGPYVVVVAAAPDLGRPAVPGAEERLRSVDLPSAWRLLPDVQVGLVCLRTAAPGKLVDQLRRLTPVRVGISPPYDDLTDTAQALRFARIALAACADDTPVTLFDEAPLAVLTMAAPDVAERFVRTVLGGLDDLPREDRDLLLQTLRTWLGSGGSANDAAERLYCHPNTVRHRLRRIEERTGRSLTDPRSLAELCLAAEAESRL